MHHSAREGRLKTGKRIGERMFLQSIPEGKRDRPGNYFENKFCGYKKDFYLCSPFGNEEKNEKRLPAQAGDI